MEEGAEALHLVRCDPGGPASGGKAERWAWRGGRGLFLQLLRSTVGPVLKLAESSDVRDCRWEPRIVFHFILMVVF